MYETKLAHCCHWDTVPGRCHAGGIDVLYSLALVWRDRISGSFDPNFYGSSNARRSAIAAAFAVLWLNVRVDRRMISPPGAANVGVEVRIELMPRLPLITLIMIPRSPTGFFPRSSCYIC